MKTTRTSGPNSWRNIGRQAARLGWPVDRALIPNPNNGINKLIQEGYDAQTKRINRALVIRLSKERPHGRE